MDKKYIDADKLIAEIERRISAYQKNFDKADNQIAKLSTDGRIASLKGILQFITSLMQERPEDIAVPRWCLEDIENSLRIQNNINLEQKTGETCQDRNIRCSLNQLRKVIAGEELTGMERLEPLKELPEVDLDKEIEMYISSNGLLDYAFLVPSIARHFWNKGYNARKDK